MGTKKELLNKYAKLVVYARQLNILDQKISSSLNYDQLVTFPKKIPFDENIITQTFLGQSATLLPKTLN